MLFLLTMYSSWPTRTALLINFYRAIYLIKYLRQLLSEHLISNYWRDKSLKCNDEKNFAVMFKSIAWQAPIQAAIYT